jgi:Asp/Glu/hydantoin racemase
MGMLMRILIINPNSDPKMTHVILSAAQSFAGDAFEVVQSRKHESTKRSR